MNSRADRTRVGESLVRSARSHRARVGSALAALGVSAGQELVLKELWREDDLTQSELGARLGIQPPTVTKALRRMERTGLVERFRDPDDARVSRVRLATRGGAVREVVEARCRDAERQTFKALSPEELSALQTLLAKLHGEDRGGSRSR